MCLGPLRILDHRGPPAQNCCHRDNHRPTRKEHNSQLNQPKIYKTNIFYCEVRFDFYWTSVCLNVWLDWHLQSHFCLHLLQTLLSDIQRHTDTPKQEIKIEANEHYDLLIQNVDILGFRILCPKVILTNLFPWEISEEDIDFTNRTCPPSLTLVSLRYFSKVKNYKYFCNLTLDMKYTPANLAVECALASRLDQHSARF